MLGTSRTNPFATDDGPERVLATLARLEVDALVVIGGDDTLGVAQRLGPFGVRSVGVPKTIDNDLSGTEVTFGFDTAVQTATDAVDRLRTTAESHHRVIVCEVMGRHAGWIAAYAGIAGGAAEILVPEVPFDLDAVCERLAAPPRAAASSSRSWWWPRARCPPRPTRRRVGQGEATSPGPVDEFGHARLGGIGGWLAGQIERRTGFEARVDHARPHPAGREPRPPSTGSWPPVSGWRPSKRSTTATLRPWWPCRRAGSSGCRSTRRSATRRRSTPGSSTGWPAPFLG